MFLSLNHPVCCCCPSPSFYTKGNITDELSPYFFANSSSFYSGQCILESHNTIVTIRAGQLFTGFHSGRKQKSQHLWHDIYRRTYVNIDFAQHNIPVWLLVSFATHKKNEECVLLYRAYSRTYNFVISKECFGVLVAYAFSAALK